jgi:hypothetical protein
VSKLQAELKKEQGSAQAASGKVAALQRDLAAKEVSGYQFPSNFAGGGLSGPYRDRVCRSTLSVPCVLR